MVALDVAISASVVLALAAAAYPVVALGRAARVAVLAAVITLILVMPLLVPAGAPFGRFLVAILAVAMAAKLFDLHVGAGRGFRPGWRVYALWLPNLSSVVLRKLGEEPRPGPRRDLVRLATSTPRAAAGLLLLVAAFRVDWRHWPFVVEHSAKVLAFFLVLVPASAAAGCALRLLGAGVREPMANPFAARTPADFWRRYNRPAQQFFLEDVFRPLGGPRSPIRATLATFVVSALIHEYVFDIAVGRIQGYQTAFFLLQGLAVLATARVRPRGRLAVTWVVGTYLFFLGSSLLFFASVGEVVPFYQRAGRLAVVHQGRRWLDGGVRSPVLYDGPEREVTWRDAHEMRRPLVGRIGDCGRGNARETDPGGDHVLSY